MDLPGEVVEDRAIGELIEVAIDMTILANVSSSLFSKFQNFEI